jgi:hypothetical protein
MRRLLAAAGLLTFGFAAGYVVDSRSAVRAQAVPVTAIASVGEDLAAVVSNGRVYTCTGMRSNYWACRPVYLKLGE